MTSLRFVSPSAGASVRAGSSGQVTVSVIKSGFLLVYTVMFTIMNANSVVAWSGEADNSGTESKADLNWPSEAGDYVVEAVLSNAFGNELARCRNNFSVTKG
jgi:hypothetical protein